MANTLREKRINKIISISVGGSIIAIIIFMIIFNIFMGRRKNNNDNFQIADNNSVGDLIEEANSSIGKNIEEAKQNTESEDVMKIQVAEKNDTTSEVEVKDLNNEKNLDNNEGNESSTAQTNSIQSEQDVLDVANTANEINSASEDNAENVNNVEQQEKDPTFIMPVEGEIVKHYGKEKLIYSETLKEWTTHLGLDIKADKTTIVKSSADGRVKSIKNDPRYGLTVVIEHQNGFTSVYSNLLTAEFVVTGEEIKSGQTIGTVGNSATFEILDDPHLHFEILKDGNSVDPEMYIKN